MTQNDEAQPKQTRRRRATYPERIELRLSTQQRDRAEALCAELNARSRGRRYTLSDVVRQSLDDGCQRSSEVSVQRLRALWTARPRKSSTTR